MFCHRTSRFCWFYFLCVVCILRILAEDCKLESHCVFYYAAATMYTFDLKRFLFWKRREFLYTHLSEFFLQKKITLSLWIVTTPHRSTHTHIFGAHAFSICASSHKFNRVTTCSVSGRFLAQPHTRTTKGNFPNNVLLQKNPKKARLFQQTLLGHWSWLSR